MSNFQCPKGHSYESSAKIRAYCPECGELSKRFGTTETVPEPIQTTEDKEVTTDPPKAEVKPDEIEVEPPKVEPTTKESKPKRNKVVKVTQKKKAPLQPVVKKQKVGAKPVVKTRVVTNVEKKASQEQTKKHTHWDQVRKAGWF